MFAVLIGDESLSLVEDSWLSRESCVRSSATSTTYTCLPANGLRTEPVAAADIDADIEVDVEAPLPGGLNRVLRSCNVCSTASRESVFVMFNTKNTSIPLHA